MNQQFLRLFALAYGAAFPPFAADAYVSGAQVKANLIVAGPPAADSDTTRAELAKLHRIEDARTPEQIARARTDETIETLFLFRDVMGEDFTPDRLPLTAALAARVKQQEPSVAAPAKAVFQRVRPYNLYKTLHPVCKTKTKDDSYPSGHATAGYLALRFFVRR